LRFSEKLIYQFDILSRLGLLIDVDLVLKKITNSETIIGPLAGRSLSVFRNWLISDIGKELVFDSFLDVIKALNYLCTLYEELKLDHESEIQRFTNDANGIPLLSGVTDLQGRAQTFISGVDYCLKFFLQTYSHFYPEFNFDISRSSFFDAKKNESDFVNHLKGKYGQDDLSVQSIEQHFEWLLELKCKRHCVEHPSGSCGLLEIKDFEIKNNQIILPSWYRVHKEVNHQPTGILVDSEAIIHNLVILFEDTLYLSCLNKKLPDLIQYSRISNDLNSLEPIFVLRTPVNQIQKIV
jgi:hypothetical protein